MARPLCFEASQCRHVAAWPCTGPNHELALVMTKERAGVMAEASVLLLRTEFQRVTICEGCSQASLNGERCVRNSASGRLQLCERQRVLIMKVLINVTRDGRDEWDFALYRLGDPFPDTSCNLAALRET